MKLSVNIAVRKWNLKENMKLLWKRAVFSCWPSLIDHCFCGFGLCCTVVLTHSLSCMLHTALCKIYVCCARLCIHMTAYCTQLTITAVLQYLDIFGASEWPECYMLFWTTVCKIVRPMLSDCCLSVCPVCLWRGVLWLNGLDGSRCHLAWR